MQNSPFTIGIGEIIWAGLLGVGGFFMWLFKKAIFGEIDQVKKGMEKLQTKDNCTLLQRSCNSILLEKMNSITQKLDMVLDRQTQIYKRLEDHINGHSE